MNEHRYQFDIIKHPFETIDDYCNDQEKGITIRNIAFCIYTVRFLEAIKEDIKEIEKIHFLKKLCMIINLLVMLIIDIKKFKKL